MLYKYRNKSGAKRMRSPYSIHDIFPFFGEVLHKSVGPGIVNNYLSLLSRGDRTFCSINLWGRTSVMAGVSGRARRRRETKVPQWPCQRHDPEKSQGKKLISVLWWADGYENIKYVKCPTVGVFFMVICNSIGHQWSRKLCATDLVPCQSVIIWW